MEIICTRKCGFRVHDRYFLDKTQFAPGICPRCSGGTLVVTKGTDTPTGHRVLLEPVLGGDRAGTVVEAGA